MTTAPVSAHRSRIVLTGGPGGGKTTAADLFRRELRNEVRLVPEAATMLFAGGFPRADDPAARRATQAAIYHVQRNLEEVEWALHPGPILLCDRGTVDGAAYWPGGSDEFFQFVGTTLKEELGRYDAVVFFQSAAVGGHEIDSGNPTRIESTSEAALLDEKLRNLWSKHPRCTFIPNNTSFIRKIMHGLSVLEQLVRELHAAPGQIG